MKSLFPTLILVLFLCSFNANAQDRVTGPEAKFQGIKKPAKKSIALYYTEHDHQPVKGPQAKNDFLRKDDCEKKQVTFFRRKNLKGPKAKNTRPEDADYWIKEDQKN